MLASTDESMLSSEYKKFKGKSTKLGKNFYNPAAKSYGRKVDNSLFDDVPEE